MEDLSVIYEDVDIRVWADNIREIKIRELREAIEDQEKLREKATEWHILDMDLERFRKIANDEIRQLQEKLIILERK